MRRQVKIDESLGDPRITFNFSKVPPLQNPIVLISLVINRFPEQSIPSFLGFLYLLLPRLPPFHRHYLLAHSGTPQMSFQKKIPQEAQSHYWVSPPFPKDFVHGDLLGLRLKMRSGVIGNFVHDWECWLKYWMLASIEVSYCHYSLDSAYLLIKDVD